MDSAWASVSPPAPTSRSVAVYAPVALCVEEPEAAPASSAGLVSDAYAEEAAAHNATRSPECRATLGSSKINKGSETRGTTQTTRRTE
jgi:hypothetical protein